MTVKTPPLSFKPEVLVEQVSRTLMNAILDDVFKGGERLVETKLQRQLGISRSPLREAFRELEKWGFVEILPRKGAFVKKISLQDIEEHFPVRVVLEALAARLACQRITAEDLQGMEEAFSGMKRAAQEKDAKLYWKCHLRFHEIFIAASGNPLLTSILRTLRVQTVWHRFYFQYHEENFRNSLALHRRILNLFVRHCADEEVIEEAVRDHLTKGFRRFIAYLKEQAPPRARQGSS